jgi:lipopolysaccharide exporter
MARGAAWMTAVKLTESGIAMLSTIILARLLSPADFGVVAMCMAVVASLEVFAAFGLDVVLIQRQDATREHYDTAWTFRVIVGAVMALAIAALAHPAAAFYKDPRLPDVMYAIACTSFLRSLENIRVVDFRKHLQFSREATLRLSVKIVGFAVTVPAAYMLRSYWALAIGMLSISVFNLLLSYLMAPYRPRLTLVAMRELFGFSSWVLLNNVITFGKTQSHTFFVGRMIGAGGLGLFNLAQEISMIGSTEIAAPINRAIYPGYAQVSSNIPQLRTTFVSVISLIMMITLPASLGIAALADVLVPTLLGDKWLDAVPLMKLLAVYGALFSLTSNCAYVILALGKPRQATHIAAWEFALTLPGFYLGIKSWGLIGVPITLVAIAAFISVPLWWSTVGRALELKVSRLLAGLWRPTLAAVVMFGVVSVFVRYAQSIALDGRLSIPAGLILGVVSYALALFSIWRSSGSPPGAEQIVFNALRTRTFGGIPGISA